jgi:hypothetical protein
MLFDELFDAFTLCAKYAIVPLELCPLYKELKEIYDLHQVIPLFWCQGRA